MQAARGVVGEVGARMREPLTLEELGRFAEKTRRKFKHWAHC